MFAGFSAEAESRARMPPPPPPPAFPPPRARTSLRRTAALGSLRFDILLDQPTTFMQVLTCAQIGHIRGVVLVTHAKTNDGRDLVNRATSRGFLMNITLQRWVEEGRDNFARPIKPLQDISGSSAVARLIGYYDPRKKASKGKRRHFGVVTGVLSLPDEDFIVDRNSVFRGYNVVGTSEH